MSRKQVDISGYLVKKFDADFRNDNWRFDCPFCGADRQRFSVSITKGLTHCWKCEYVNSILGFVSDTEGVGLGDAFRIIRKYTPVRTRKRSMGDLQRKTKAAPVNSKIPGYSELAGTQQQSQTIKMAKRYLASRGVSKRDISYWRLGVSSDPEYAGRIISPFLDGDRVVYFVARKFMGPGPKYKNPSLEDWGIGKSELIYNYQSALARAHRGICIVEGVYDVYGTGRHAIALLGKHPSQYQLSQIILMNPAEVEIMLDADAVDEAYKLASVMGDLFPTKITKLRTGDPGDRTSGPREEVQYSFRELVRNKLRTKR